jgi:hypothetical protein
LVAALQAAKVKRSVYGCRTAATPLAGSDAAKKEPKANFFTALSEGVSPQTFRTPYKNSNKNKLFPERSWFAFGQYTLAGFVLKY